MDRKILETYQQRVNEFLLSRNDDLVYRDYIHLDVSLSVTDEVIPYDRRLDLEYKKVKEGEVWGYDWASGWFHMSAEVPESFAGKELCLRIHTGSEILVFDEHGEPLYGLTGYSCFDELYCKERYVIGKDFRPGEKLDFWLQSAAHGLFGCALPRPYDLETPVLTTGGGSRLLKHMRLCVFDRELWSLLLDMRVLNGIVKSYGLDDFRARRILKLLNDAIDIVNYRWENASAARAMLAEKAFTATASPAAPVAWSMSYNEKLPNFHSKMDILKQSDIKTNLDMQYD